MLNINLVKNRESNYKIRFINFFLTFYFLLLFNVSYSQNLDSLFQGYQKLYFENNEQRILEKDLYNIFFNDVFTYFDIEEEYSTPLKKNVFKSTKEYKVLYDSLQNLKRSSIKKIIYIELDLTPSSKYMNGVEYDLVRNGLKIDMSERSVVDKNKNVLDYLIFNNLILSSKVEYPQLGNLSSRHDILFLPLSKKNGLDFEDSNNTTKLYILFSPTLNTRRTSYNHPTHYQFSFDNNYILTNVKKVMLTINDRIVYQKNY
jgi:hypothetical protein